MTLAVVYTRAGIGVQAPLVTVETHLAPGLPAFSIVGLPEAAVKESKDRVRAALLTAGYEFPMRRITVNLAPADLPKDGGRYDLPIALSILAASEQLRGEHLAAHEFVGELALSGELRPLHGVLPVACAAREAGRRLIVPAQNVTEASLAGREGMYPAGSLLEVCAHLNGQQRLSMAPEIALAVAAAVADLADVRGQHGAKRALTIAAAGGHHLLFIGPPGTGKTMLASRLPGILPAMSEGEALEAAAIASISPYGFDAARWKQRSFRQPHHTASGVALVGGGAIPKPGEISLAHGGVLFLDELPEFERHVLEVLREPLESGRVVISRAAAQAEFPARFQLVAAMNPCPCGHYGEPQRCRCTPLEVRRYLGKLSGPFLDRIDLQVDVPPLPKAQLLDATPEATADSASIRQQVEAARERQLQRSGKANAQLGARELQAVAALQKSEQQLLEQAIDKLGLSARATHRVIRVARTIADLENADQLQREHLLEALSYRRLDRLQQTLPKA